MIRHSKPTVGELEKRYVKKVLQGSLLIGGDYQELFSSELKNFIGVKQVWHTNSGYHALRTILRALDTTKKEVLMPSYVCESVYFAVIDAGFKPVLIDIGKDWVSTAEKYETKITSNTAAILVVYIFGVRVCIDDILNLGLPVIEDICQAFGLSIKERKAGSYGLASFCSFSPIKCITTAMHSGAIFSTDSKFSERIDDELRVQVVIPEINSAFGLAQLRSLEEFLKIRELIAAKYQEVFKSREWVLQTSYSKGMNYRFVTKISIEVTEVIARASSQEIILRRGVDELLHRKFLIGEVFLPETDSSFQATVSWPIYPSLTDEEFNRIEKFIKTI